MELIVIFRAITTNPFNIMVQTSFRESLLVIEIIIVQEKGMASGISNTTCLLFQG